MLVIHLFSCGSSSWWVEHSCKIMNLEFCIFTMKVWTFVFVIFYAEFVWFIAEYNEQCRLEIKISIRDRKNSAKLICVNSKFILLQPKTKIRIRRQQNFRQCLWCNGYQKNNTNVAYNSVNIYPALSQRLVCW